MTHWTSIAFIRTKMKPKNSHYPAAAALHEVVMHTSNQRRGGVAAAGRAPSRN
jgi:hypothetical protein